MSNQCLPHDFLSHHMMSIYLVVHVQFSVFIIMLQILYFIKKQNVRAFIIILGKAKEAAIFKSQPETDGIVEKILICFVINLLYYPSFHHQLQFLCKISHNWKSLISFSREFLLSIDKPFIFPKRLGTNLSLYVVQIVS